ncbi:hypothetical protein FGO68_gene14774 [Halteria grandinella]|uniref:Uncharacterized protein n=1 Tax=Halteria grandinella TaxID=5974 RepID=A0A8J8T9S6_HALGN|nr:hypothetical protein FGO68_gene14774 [Halteria grandinella]
MTYFQAFIIAIPQMPKFEFPVVDPHINLFRLTSLQTSHLLLRGLRRMERGKLVAILLPLLIQLGSLAVGRVQLITKPTETDQVCSGVAKDGAPFATTFTAKIYSGLFTPSLKKIEIGQAPIQLINVGLAVKVGSTKLKNGGRVELPRYLTVSVTGILSASDLVGRVRLVVNPTAMLLFNLRECDEGWKSSLPLFFCSKSHWKSIRVCIRCQGISYSNANRSGLIIKSRYKVGRAVCVDIYYERIGGSYRSIRQKDLNSV